MKYKIIFIFFSAFLIRLISLNQSLWLDEATTARVVQQYNFWGITTKFSPNDFHPPLYYLFMKVWSNVFGYSEIALRFPSVIFSLLTGCLVYLLGRTIKDEKTGLWAAVFFLINPLIVYYSQEARMYMMTTFLLTTTLWSFWGAQATPESNNDSGQARMTKEIILFNIFAILSFITFYGSIFLIIPMVLYLFYKKQFNYFFISLLFILFSILVISPILYQQFSNAKEQMQMVPNWNQVLGTVNLKNLFLIPVKFSIGRISFLPKWFYWSITGIWSLFVWYFFIKGGLRSKFLFFLVIGSLGLGILFSFFTPLLQYFRFLYLLPILSILLALGSAKFHRVKLGFSRFGGKWIVLTGFLIFSTVYLLNPTFHREDWKSLAKSLPRSAKVYMIISSSDPIKYYRNDLKIDDLKKISNKISKKEFYVIPYSSLIHGVEYKENLTSTGFKLIKETSYRGLILEKWRY